MAVSLDCTSCGKRLKVAESKRGKQIKCPSCGEILRVPDDEDELDDVEELPQAQVRSKKRRGKKTNSGTHAAAVWGAVISLFVLIGMGIAVQRGRSAVPIAVENPSAVPISGSATGANSVTSLATANRASSSAMSGSPGAAVPPAGSPPPEVESPDPKALAANASDEFFSRGMIPELRIEIADAEMAILRSGPDGFEPGSPRPYVTGRIHENGTTTYENVSIKLKGSAGSFRPVDDRPALTINVGKIDKEQTFHGLSKFHLNNSVQDDTYLHEWICEELFRGAKLPATRVTHARVWLNDRDLGIYVLKSSFDKTFMERHFGTTKGNLYEGGFVQDIDADLERDAGKGPDDRRDLKALLEACREPDADLRWKRIEEHLDVDEFLTFMAMEMMVGHWDGYTLNHNNYRLYFDAKHQKAHFLAHGMDQVFGDAGASIIDFPPSIVGSIVMLKSDWRKRYRERVGELMSLFSPTEELLKRVDVANDRLRPVLARMNPDEAREHDERVKGLKERLVARVENLIQQQSQPDPQPQEFDEDGRLKLVDWYAVSESPEPKLDLVDLPKGIKAYSIQFSTKGMWVASWRCKTLLAKGKYQLHAKLKTQQVSAANEEERAVGAGIRISGMERSNARKGTVNWSRAEFEFTVEEEMRTVEFVAELIAKRGQVWFDVESLYLTKVPTE